MELSIIPEKEYISSINITDITLAMCGIMFLTFMRMQSVFATNNAKNIIDANDSTTTTTTTTTSTITEKVVTSVSNETVPIKRRRPKVVNDIVESHTAINSDVETKSETDDPVMPERYNNYLSTILKDNEDIYIIILLLNGKTMECNAKYANERIKITHCDFLPSLVGCPFHTPKKLLYRLCAVLEKTKHCTANPKQNIWEQMFVERNDKMVSIASLR
jgi:hypothetical protein